MVKQEVDVLKQEVRFSTNRTFLRRDMVKQEVDVSKQEVRFSTTWASPTETNSGLGLSIGPSYAEIWANRKWMFWNRQSSQGRI